MNHNIESDRSIETQIPNMYAELARLVKDPQIAKQHESCVAAHRKKIEELKKQPKYAEFFEEIGSARQQRLSRLANRFGMNVFEIGSQTVPDKVIELMENGVLKYFNVRKDGSMFDDQVKFISREQEP